MTARGRFVVLEGADGAGTTTQARALAETLNARGHAVHITAEPSTGAVGRLIREQLATGEKNTARWQSLALLFAADRLLHVEDEIEPRLAAGEWVISDRYALSSLVYQGLHVDEDWVKTLNQYAVAPDIVLLVTLPLPVALERISGRAGTREVYENEALQARVHARYAALAEAVDAVVVDGQGTQQTVTARLISAIESRSLLGD